MFLAYFSFSDSSWYFWYFSINRACVELRSLFTARCVFWASHFISHGTFILRPYLHGKLHSTRATSKHSIIYNYKNIINFAHAFACNLQFSKKPQFLGLYRKTFYTSIDSIFYALFKTSELLWKNSVRSLFPEHCEIAKK